MSQPFNTDPPRPELRPDMARPAADSPSTFGSSPAPGQFYSPPPSSAPPVSDAPSRWHMAGLGIVAAVALAAAAWYGVTTRSVPAAGPHPAATALAKSHQTFSVSSADADYKATAQLKALLAGESGASPTDSTALNAANGPALMKLAQSSPQLTDDIKSGRRVLYRVHLLDFLAEDGDHAELFVDGVGLGDVYLKNAGTEILIPLAAGIPTQMKLLATSDGGGGVTVGFVSSLGEVRTRIMQVGEFEEWQVIVQ